MDKRFQLVIALCSIVMTIVLTYSFLVQPLQKDYQFRKCFNKFVSRVEERDKDFSKESIEGAYSICNKTIGTSFGSH